METQQRISEYSNESTRKVPFCSQDQSPFVRELVAGWTGSGLENVLAGDRHYEGMRAPDGTDISSRTKHREYMRRNGLTTSDDFKGEWSKAQEIRELRRKGEYDDKSLKKALEREVYRRIQ